jgi:hypothetical protein
MAVRAAARGILGVRDCVVHSALTKSHLECFLLRRSDWRATYRLADVNWWQLGSIRHLSRDAMTGLGMRDGFLVCRAEIHILVAIAAMPNARLVGWLQLFPSQWAEEFEDGRTVADRQRRFHVDLCFNYESPSSPPPSPLL